jgi:hypothetical protein
MAQQKPNRIAEWILLLRQNYPVARQHLAEWVVACREQPRLFWETTAVRYAACLVGGLVGVWLISTLVGWFVPPPPPTARPAATTADYHVICTNPRCDSHFVIHRKFGFRGFPVECPRCRQQTGVSARRCLSEQCRGQWVAPVQSHGKLKCPECGREFE